MKRDMHKPSQAASQKGLALLMVLWVMTILTVIVLSFTAVTRTETLAAAAFRQATEKKFLAEAGIERGIMEIIFRNLHKDQAVTLEGLEPWKADGSPATVQMDTGSVTVSLFDESGKVDINRTPEVILRNLLKNLGVAPEDADIIADSIMDWKDADDLHRLHGAESDYYGSLPVPYKPKNADFETVEELLFVRGITPAVLYGDGTKKGIYAVLTVQGNSDKINVNAAPREVLLATGMPEETAGAILQIRQGRSLANLQEAGVPAEFFRYLSTGGGSTFTIESVGKNAAGPGGYVIRATVSVDAKNQFHYLSYRSPADVPHE